MTLRLRGFWTRRRRDGTGRGRIALPPGIGTVYAVGDVHGRLDLLRQLEARIGEDLAAREGASLVVMLGDYIDRGRDSAGVLSHLVDGDGPAPRICLCGNHEAMMVDFLSDPRADHTWLELGGVETLRSYHLDIHHILATHRRRPQAVREILDEAVPRAHRAFLDALPVAAFDDRFIYVHAGVRPGIELERQREEDLLWIREPFLSEGPGLGRIVVHGHTQQERLLLIKGRLGVDTGGRGNGALSAVRIAEDGIFGLSAQG